MPYTIQRMILRLRRALKRAGNAAIGATVIGGLQFMRWVTIPHLMAPFGGWIMRQVGPWLREHRIARANLVSAFPEKSAAEIDSILSDAWDNLGHVGVEFAHLDRLWDHDFEHPERRSRFDIPPEAVERFKQLRDDGKPALVFAAHTANWELPAVVAAATGIDNAVLYRRPNIAIIDRWLKKTRGALMGTLIPTGLVAPVTIAHALSRGTHVGMLVDQYYVRGVEVTFFGRRTSANPLLARLARQIDCPIHGIRIVRLPRHRFRIELTEAIVPARDDDGQINVAATTQIIMSEIEGWIREYPGQWLWQHRRWR